MASAGLEQDQGNIPPSLQSTNCCLVYHLYQGRGTTWVIRGRGRGRETDEPTTDEGRGQTPNKGRRGNQAPPQAIAAPLGRAAATSKQRHKKEQRPPRAKRRPKQKTEGRGGRGGKPPDNEPYRTQE